MIKLPRTVAIGSFRRGSVIARPWIFNRGAVEEAYSFFDLTWPVIVKLSQATLKNGTQRSRRIYLERGAEALAGNSDAEFVHVITVSTYNPLELASQTLWHELTHCTQDERYGHVKMSQLYAANPLHYEEEAFEHEILHNILPLTLGATG